MEIYTSNQDVPGMQGTLATLERRLEENSKIEYSTLTPVSTIVQDPEQIVTTSTNPEMGLTTIRIQNATHTVTREENTATGVIKEITEDSTQSNIVEIPTTTVTISDDSKMSIVELSKVSFAEILYCET